MPGSTEADKNLVMHLVFKLGEQIIYMADKCWCRMRRCFGEPCLADWSMCSASGGKFLPRRDGRECNDLCDPWKSWRSQAPLSSPFTHRTQRYWRASTVNAWATSVFSHLDKREAVEKLWNCIFLATRLNEESPMTRLFRSWM